MGRDRIQNCVLEVGLAGVTLDRELVRVFSEEPVKTGTKVLTLLLDGQTHLLQAGRFAYLEIDSRDTVLSFAVLERFPNSDIQVLISSEGIVRV